MAPKKWEWKILIVTAHQPGYLPWLGYFDKIAKSDLFIFLDSVQFEKNSFTNRNKIKSPQGPIWLTVPVKLKGHLASTINELPIDNTQQWQDKHLRSIYANYKKVPSFELKYGKLNELYRRPYEFLADLCYDHLLFWLRELGLSDKRILRSHELPVTSHKSDLILDLCSYTNADVYISGVFGKEYLDEEKFCRNQIKIVYQGYNHPVYPQAWGDFIPYLSILDFWMNCDQYRMIWE